MYPPADITIEALCKSAQIAAKKSGMIHPEDIATAMVVAIESAWPVIGEVWKG